MENKSYLYIFFITIVLVFVGGFIGGAGVSLSVFLLTFLLTLIMQLKSGYALNRQWVLNISRYEHPVQYWGIIALNILLLLWFLLLFYLVYQKK